MLSSFGISSLFYPRDAQQRPLKEDILFSLHACTWMHACTCMYAFACMHLHAFVCMHLDACMHLYAYFYPCMHLHACKDRERDEQKTT